MKQAGQNVELPNFTQALYDARELAMERRQAEAEEVAAEGIVGVQLSERNHGWGSHVIEFFAVGTAIVAYGEERSIEAPKPVLDLSWGRERGSQLRRIERAGPDATSTIVNCARSIVIWESSMLSSWRRRAPWSQPRRSPGRSLPSADAAR